MPPHLLSDCITLISLVVTYIPVPLLMRPMPALPMTQSHSPCRQLQDTPCGGLMPPHLLSDCITLISWVVSYIPVPLLMCPMPALPVTQPVPISQTFQHNTQHPVSQSPPPPKRPIGGIDSHYNDVQENIAHRIFRCRGTMTL
jgi:hypothetical protein